MKTKITDYISKVLSICFYGALFFISIGFVFLIVNGAGARIPVEEVDFLPVIRTFFNGNSEGAFMIAAFTVCLAPFFSAIVLIVDSVKKGNPKIILFSVVLIVLLAISLIFE